MKTARDSRETLKLATFLAACALALAPHVGSRADDDKTAQGPDRAKAPLRDGLEFWFDAATLAKPEQNSPAADTATGVEVAQWTDRSGHQRHATQSAPAARPHLIEIGGRSALRFDGVDDHLRVIGLDRRTAAATVFIVAAPASNPGGFRGLLAANAPGSRDYETGFTVDLGPAPTAAFTQLNVEGRGFGVAQNLRSEGSPFGTLQAIEATIRPSDRVVQLTIDGKRQRSRPYAAGDLALSELTLGARYYTNGPGRQEVRGFVEGLIAEVLVYGRELTPEEAKGVRDYLQAKHAPLREALAARQMAAGSKPLRSIANPPPVQMFVPGFEVRELPLALPNINNVRCRRDGKLLALAYNGDVYRLSDEDGDGLEETATLFWKNTRGVRSPIGMDLTPPGYRHGDGLVMATKSECLLVVDTDGDDTADREIVVASGWTDNLHSVGALGVAVDPKDGSVYFGLGTANFTEAYLKDHQGRPHYRTLDERGAILKVAPDFSKREVYCSGIRFPVAVVFHPSGDLFCTDQEGATWAPNGNPFDELLHVQQGRHYGFPARHPRLLPNVVDEPSTYDYGPQHQSTCGLTFNEPVVDGGPTFGPAFWRGDALVCGYSRGKLYRTKLVKTPAGYVADNRLIACLNMLTVDSCVTRDGDLVVAVHSGGPDWGSGPAGQGKLHKVQYRNPELPQPVATWAAAPDEVRIAFDNPLDPGQLRGLREAAEITYGPYVRAGDELESLRPGYDVVGMQMGSMRRDLPLHSAQLTGDGRTLILSTPSHAAAAWHAIRLPRLGPALAAPPDNKLLRQHARIDLDYNLSGVMATWQGDEGNWSGWLPHCDLAASRALLDGSAEHQPLWPLLRSRGTLRVRTQLDLTHMLRARVQPGSKLDYELPPEDVSVTLTATAPFALKQGSEAIAAEKHESAFVATIHRRTTTQSLWFPIELELNSPGGGCDLTIAWHTADDLRARPLPRERLLVPWATPLAAESRHEAGERIVPELAGGSWARGRTLFFTEAAACSKCHSIHGQGAAIGPDLSNLVHRDYASVLRDLTLPSYAINPDYIAHSVALKDGRILTGTLRNNGNRLEVTDARAEVTSIDQGEVEEIAPSTKSIMPDGLADKLGPEKLRDLLAFLLLKPPHMPLDGAANPPPPRSRKELAAVLAGAPVPPLPTRPIRIALVAGPKDHGPGEHDYPAWQKAWAELLAAAPDTHVSTAWDWPAREDFDKADVLVFYHQGGWTPQRARDIDAFLLRGGGLAYIHYAVDGGRDAPGFAERIGLAWAGGRSSFRHGPLELDFAAAGEHPIARNLSRVKLVDESYWNLVGDAARVQVLATGVEDGQKRPLCWTLEPSMGRVFVSIPGHFSWTFDDPVFRVLLLRGIAWTAREPVDRFNALATPGARIGD